MMLMMMMVMKVPSVDIVDIRPRGLTRTVCCFPNTASCACRPPVCRKGC
jgi:hypothetical protein